MESKIENLQNHFKDEKYWFRHSDVSVIVNHPDFETYFPGIIFEKEDIDWGDRYYNEHGIRYFVTIFDKKYDFGYSQTIEDNDNWAQAESSQSTWINCNNEHSTYREFANDLLNFKAIRRNKIIERII